MSERITNLQNVENSKRQNGRNAMRWKFEMSKRRNNEMLEN